MVKLYFLAGLGAVIFLANACKKDIGKKPVEPAPAINACDTITYDKHIKPIITSNCNGCHAPGTLSSGLDLSTYTLLKTKAESGTLKKRVIDDLPPASMPKGTSKLPQNQLDLIQCWITNGMKEK